MSHAPDESTAAQRRAEIAQLLAAGLLRFRRRVAATSAPSPESPQNPLDVCGPLSAHDGTSAPAVKAGGDPDGDSTYE